MNGSAAGGVRFDLVAVGEVLLDVTLSTFVPGEVAHGPVRLRVGGTAANAALAAAAGGARAAVVARVGADAAGDVIRAHLRAAGVEPLLATDPHERTGTFVEATVGGARTVVVDRGASAALHPDDLPTVETAGLLVSGYLLFQEGGRDAARTALGAFGARVVGVTAGSAALLAKLDRRRAGEWATGIDLFVANADESRALTGLDPKAAALELARIFRAACVTMGAAGAFAAANGRVEHEQADEPARASDALGAGDALAGVMVVSLAAGDDLATALRAGVAAGARGAPLR